MSEFANLNDRQILPNTPGAFQTARLRLRLSQKELADKLNTSLNALVRWERGDQEPSPDVLERLERLLQPNHPTTTSVSKSHREVVFESNGARGHTNPLPLFQPEPVRMLDEPRSSILDQITDGELWDDGDLALADILSRRDDAAKTRQDPLDEEISAGKNTYTYDAHTYHTKVPPQGIANVISKYLPDGGTILDPFSGSGMTGVAARYLGCDVILNELSPAASFISYNFMQEVDFEQFNHVTS